MLAGTAFDQFAQLYEQCLATSPALTPPVVDDMELWEVAVVLGKARPADNDQAASGEPPSSSEDAAMRRYEAIRRRKAGLPELDEEPDRPQRIDPGLAKIIPTNAPDRLR